MTFIDDYELLERMALALAIGLLFGIERGWKTRAYHGGRRTAGLRTFVLIGLAGGITGLLSHLLGGVVLGLAFLGFAGLVAVSYIESQRAATNPDLGITTEVAALLTFLLSALVVVGDILLPVAVAVVAVTFCHGKKFLHRWIAGLERLELAAALQLLIISLVLLPILPNKGFGPGEILNPFQLWLMVVLISGLSFVGYIACKYAGARVGLLLVGVLGGLASSTAVTLSFSRLARQSPALATTFAGGIAVASTVMFVRIFVLVWIFRPVLLADLVLPIAVMTVISLAGGVFLAFRRTDSPAARHSLELSDPSELATAVTFGVLLALVLVASYLVNEWLGQEAVYGVALVSGLADVDALTLSMAELAGRDGFALHVAANAIVVAALANTATKLFVVVSLAGGVAAKAIGAVFGLAIAGGLVVLFAF
jgi:uncharacterized membrane protein (DUF4010 family)